MKWIAPILLIAWLGVSCSNNETYFVNTEAILHEWDDANQLASRTARIAISQPVSKLQDIRRKAQAVVPPTSAKATHEDLLSYMDAVIDGYLEFMGGHNKQAETSLLEAKEKRTKWHNEYEALKNGK